MTLTTPTTLGLLALAAGLGLYVGGPLGAGIVAGAIAGAAIAGFALALQRKIARERPQFLIHAVLGGFLLKAFAMLVTTLAIRFVPALDEAFDAVGYLIAFAVTAIGVLVPATLDTLRLVGVRTRSSSTTTVSTKTPRAESSL